MSSTEQEKRKKLYKALELYRSQSDALTQKSQILQQQIAALKYRMGELDHEREQKEIYFVTLVATPIDRTLAHQSLQLLSAQRRTLEVQLLSTNEEFELNQAELMPLLAKIESIERLIERLGDSIKMEQRKQEQVVADERYLNTHFANRSLT